jgi:hypothetical protein
MTCEHLHALETELLAAGIRETYRGTPWSQNCREWVYFDVVLDTSALATRLNLPACVEVHENRDAKSGTERGFVCTRCDDAIMGRLSGAPVYS